MKEKARIGAVEILTGEQRLLEKLKPALPDSTAAPLPPAGIEASIGIILDYWNGNDS